MKRLLIAGAALVAVPGMPAVSNAQDVAVFSKADAAALLEDEPVGTEAAAATSATESPPNRAWSLGGNRPQTPVTRPVAAPASRNAAEITLSHRQGPVAASAGMAARVAPIVPRTLLPLQFGLASAQLSPQSKANLKNLADVLLEPRHLDKRVRIIGHADKSGSPTINQVLSEQRAHSAVDYLERIGVNPARLEAVGVSSDDPLPDMSEFDPRNRRLEIERIR
jgi:outer membrane protein OmpA-like peptidoglycan-associated protein